MLASTKSGLATGAVMNIFQYMRAFVSVAETGSFTAAAELMDTTTANLSRAVSNLETHLQARLFNRTTRRIALTEAGTRYLVRCQQILASIAEAESEAGVARLHPIGRLKVHAMNGVGMHYVIEAIAKYRETYPDVTFDLTLSNRIPDLLEEGYDVSIVLATSLADSGYVSQRLGSIYSLLCASPSYLKKKGVPTIPSQLASHHCLSTVSLNPPDDHWLFDGPGGLEVMPIDRPPFLVNSIEAMMVAIRNGIGIGVLPIYTAISGLRDGTLVRVLPHYRMRELNLYAVYPSRLFLDAKTKTLVEHLRESLPMALAAEERILEVLSSNSSIF